MLINDKSQLKRNVEQIGFQLAHSDFFVFFCAPYKYSYLLTYLLKLARVSADLTDSGRLFHTVGPATEKAQSPNLVLVRGSVTVLSQQTTTVPLQI